MVVVILLLLVFCLVVRQIMRLVLLERRHSLNGHVPNVSRIPLIGAAWQMRNFHPDNLHEKFAEYVKKYGSSFMATVCGRIVMVTAEPRYVNALLLSPYHLRKSVLYGTLSNWLGNGLLLRGGKEWRQMRKMIAPTFSRYILEQFITVFDRQSMVLVDKLKLLANGKDPINIYPFMGLATLDIISETAMGVSIDAQMDANSSIVQAVEDVTHVLATRFMRPFLLPPMLFRFCWPHGYHKQSAAVQILHQFTDKIIAKRRQQLQLLLLQQQQLAEQEQQPLIKGKNVTALLDTLLLSSGKLTDAEIRDEVSTFIFAGHDTTTAAASFCLYLLSRHPVVQQRLFMELKTHYNDHDDDDDDDVDVKRPVVYGDFAALPYLHCVVKESLRLYPPIPAIGRWLENDLIVDDTRIAAGTNVIIMLWQLLRDESIYKDSNIFHPERHMGETTTATHEEQHSYIPFSAGPRSCVGQRFALFEVKTIVINVMRHLELLPLGVDVEPSIDIVLRSRTGVNFGLQLRNAKCEILNT